MADGNGQKVMTEWMKEISASLSDLHDKLDNKADHEDVEKLEVRVQAVDSKVNRITGAWAAVIAIITLGGTILALI